MKTMKFDVADRVARITFTRPEALNSITEDVIAELNQVCDRIDEDPGVRTLVITGSEDAFCVGLDLELLKRAFSDPPFFQSILEAYGGLLTRLAGTEVPVIAAVNGTARAGGFELILACDLVVLAEEARVGDVHSPFGVIPGGGSTQRLPRLVGRQRAFDLIATGRWLRPGEAVASGLAAASVPRIRLDEAVDRLVADLVSKPRALLATVKRLVRTATDTRLEEGLGLEIAAFVDRLRAEGSEAVEGFTAFIEGRTPDWA